MKKTMLWIISAGILVGIGVVLYAILIREKGAIASRSMKVRAFLNDPEAHTDWLMQANTSVQRRRS